MQITVTRGAGCFSPSQTASIDTDAIAPANPIAAAHLDALARRARQAPEPSGLPLGTVPSVSLTIVDGDAVHQRTYPGGRAPAEVEALVAAVLNLNRPTPGARTL